MIQLSNPGKTILYISFSRKTPRSNIFLEQQGLYFLSFQLHPRCFLSHILVYTGKKSTFS